MTHPICNLRHATPHDLPAIMEIEHEAFANGIVESPDVFLQRIHTYPDGFLLLEAPDITGDIVICGYISSERWQLRQLLDPKDFTLGHDIRDSHKPSGTELYISSMGLRTHTRGKGYGSFLFSALLDAHKDKGLRSAALIVGESWMAARRIYRSRGFKELFPIPGFIKPKNGNEEAVIVMRKNLENTTQFNSEI